jgi:hypothetical protein
MASFDLYGDIQLKAGNPKRKAYVVGEKVPVEDGVYVTPHGMVVVRGGKLLTTFDEVKVIDKWGTPIGLDEMLSARKPVAQTT